MARLKTLLLKIVILATTVQIRCDFKNPVISRCISSKSDSLSCGQECYRVSNSTFKSETPGMNVLTLEGAVPEFLHLKCTGSHPIRWLSPQPVGSIFYHKIEFEAELSLPTYALYITISIRSNFSKILRCENHKDSNFAADILFNFPKAEKSSEVIPSEMASLNFSYRVDKNRVGESVLPCVENFFNSMTTLIPRSNKPEATINSPEIRNLEAHDPQSGVNLESNPNKKCSDYIHSVLVLYLAPYNKTEPEPGVTENSTGMWLWHSAALILFIVLVISNLVGWCKYRQSKALMRNLTENEVFFNGWDGPTQYYEGVAATLPEDKFISENRLVINVDDILGEGQYCVVYKGTLDEQIVAVKTTKADADVENFKAFLREIKVVNFIGDHENIVRFHGVMAEKIQDRICFAAFELSPFGTLRNYLINYASTYVVSRSDSDEQESITRVSGSKDQVSLTHSILLSFCRQISSGMEYLAEKKVIHGDLAARNVLVFSSNVVKITDYGLSRKLYECSEYVKTKQAPLPWRWLALESLRYLHFSSKSDVWSFGVTIWEIFSFGQVPYSGLTWSPEFGDSIEDGLRLSKPRDAHPKVYDLMKKCWEIEPENRPTFSECKHIFMNFQSAVDMENNTFEPSYE